VIAAVAAVVLSRSQGCGFASVADRTFVLTKRASRANEAPFLFGKPCASCAENEHAAMRWLRLGLGGFFSKKMVEIQRRLATVPPLAVGSGFAGELVDCQAASIAGDDPKPEEVGEQSRKLPQQQKDKSKKMATKLFVGNLSFNTTEGEVLDLFKQAGNVTACELITDKFTGKSRGFAFVTMGSQEEATAAVSQFNGKELDGPCLTVNEARPREERPVAVAVAAVSAAVVAVAVIATAVVAAVGNPTAERFSFPNKRAPRTSGALFLFAVNAVGYFVVPQRWWRNLSQGENTILSASNPIRMITSMMAMTWSIACNSRP